MSTIRECPYSGKSVIIAPERLHRPFELSSIQPQNSDDIDLCPFEKGSESSTPKEIFSINDKDGEWITRVVPNRYHALSIEANDKSYREGFFTYTDGLGAHEVIIETPSHDLRADQYTIDLYRIYLRTLIARIKDLKNDTRLKYIQVFKNHGSKAGATLKHPHSQIIATPFIPPKVDRQINRCREYYHANNRSLLLDTINEELRVKKRIIYENETFVAFTPYASSSAFEIMISPKTEIHSIEFINTAQKIDLARSLKSVFSALYALLGEFDYNLLFHNAPPVREHVRADYFYHIEKFFTFNIQILPRIYTTAGYELSTGIDINPVTPESAAQKLLKEMRR